MAEFDELDGLLRTALGKAGQPGDSAGVADAIRSRVAAGDSGTSAPGPVAPGWGRRLFGMLAGGVLLGVLLVGGTATGVVLALSADGDAAPTAEPTVQEIPSPTPTAPTASPTRTPTPTPTPTPTATESPIPAPAPAPAPAPPPPADTTPPTVQASANPTVIYATNGSDTTITAIAADAVGVTQVSISWSGFTSGSASMTPSGGAWTYYFDLPPTPTAGASQIDFLVIAADAAGNTSSTVVSVTVTP